MCGFSYQAVEILLTWPSAALKSHSKCSFTLVNSAFSLNFALHLTQFSEFQQPVIERDELAMLFELALCTKILKRHILRVPPLFRPLREPAEIIPFGPQEASSKKPLSH